MLYPKILIAGGDLRQIACAEALSHKYPTAAVGLRDDLLPNGLVPADGGDFNCAVLPVPPLDDDGYIPAPCGSGRLAPADILPLLSPGALILAGKISPALGEAFPGKPVEDYMAREELALGNAIPTAEGAIRIALDELPVTLHGSRVLVVGMGRIGLALVEILKGFGAETSVLVRSKRGAARARLCGARPVFLPEIGSDWRLVINTAPGKALARDTLSGFSKDTLFIDLASKPGGVDFASASELGLKTIWALGLPGRSAPATAGRLIAETVDEILAERREAACTTN